MAQANADVGAAEIVLQVGPTRIAHPVDTRWRRSFGQTPFPGFVHARWFFELVAILGRNEEYAAPIQPDEGLRDFILGPFFVGGPVDEFTIFEFLEGFLHSALGLVRPVPGLGIAAGQDAKAIRIHQELFRFVQGHQVYPSILFAKHGRW